MTTVEGYLGEIRFDGSTVTIAKKMRGEVSVPLSAIQSVAIVPAGLGMSGIRFAVAGGSVAGAATSTALTGHRQIAEDPYAITFRNKRKGAFQELAAAINAARA